MVVTEALAHGLPVITTTGGALADTLPDDAGLAVSPGDSEALADGLRRLLSDPDAYASLAAGASRAAAALPDWDDAGARFVAILDRVRERMSGTSPRPRARCFADDWLIAARGRGSSQPGPRPCRPGRRVICAEKAGGRPACVIDLGAGRGSNLRYLVPRLGRPIEWRLIDQDAGLLATAVRDYAARR